MEQQKIVMTNEQSRRMELCARLDELEQIQNRTTDPETLKYLAEREKALKAALQSTLNA